MLIGILSDTHDRVDAMAAAVHTLAERGAEYFVHCGDVCAPDLLDHLAGLPAAFVFGNNDWDRAALQDYAEALGIQCCGLVGDLELGGKRVAVIHGDDLRAKRRILADQRHDYLLQGHTHARHDERVGRTRIINPGALHRAAIKTAALLDTDADRLEFLTFPPATKR